MVNYTGASGDDIYEAPLAEASTVDGAAGDDSLTGGDLDDRIDGGEGDDTIDGGRGDDQAFGSGGRDELYGDGGSDTLDAGFGRDRLFGGNGDDGLFGSRGDDLLTGGDGDDSLDGGEGRDTLIEGAGFDVLVGGAGRDLFVLTSAAVDPEFQDLILDFERKDQIDLTAIDADLDWVGQQAFTFIGEAEFSGQAGELRLELFQGGNQFIQADRDGDGASDFTVAVLGQPMTGADLIL